MIDRRRLLLAGAASFLAPAARAQAVRGEDGVYVVTLSPAKAPLLGPDSEWVNVWTYEGLAPGPVLKATQGQPLKVRIVNGLPEPTTVHWQGVRVPNAMDGTTLTQQPIPPGGSFDYAFTPPDAGTFLYRPGISAATQLDRGLLGALVVEEAAPSGFEDVVMVIDDWTLTADGQVDESDLGNLEVAAESGRLGNWFTVNGRSRPRLKADAGARVRVRLVNASNARTMGILVKGADPWIVARDGQPIPARHIGEAPVELLPGGRADLVLPRGDQEVTFAIEIAGEPLELAYLARQGEHRADGGEDPRLPPNPAADVATGGALEVTIPIEGGAGGGLASAKVGDSTLDVRQLLEKRLLWAVAGHAGLPEKPLFVAPKDAVVAITFDNRTDWAQALHLHGHSARIVKRGGAAVDEPGLRDVVAVAARSTLTIAFRADNPGKWLIEAQIPERADTGLVTWFGVEGGA
jgi:FtsP/CotA-like multicopper oxidase with cupredoxin domain